MALVAPQRLGPYRLVAPRNEKEAKKNAAPSAATTLNPVPRHTHLRSSAASTVVQSSRLATPLSRVVNVQSPGAGPAAGAGADAESAPADAEPAPAEDESAPAEDESTESADVFCSSSSFAAAPAAPVGPAVADAATPRRGVHL